MTNELENLRGLVMTLFAEVDSLKREVDSLKRENGQLCNRLAKYETPKNSNNSSIPPSKDENRPRRTQSLREKTGRKPGGQKNRKGKTLEMTPTPDLVEEHAPGYCNCCGGELSDTVMEFAGKRQVYDLPEIKFKVTEHRVYKRVCSCGHETTGTYPDHVKAPVSYGPNVEGMIGYLHARQYIPFKRMQEMFADIFHLPISEGGIHYILSRLVNKALPGYEMIRQRLANSTGAVGGDESGVKVNGDKFWAWVWQNHRATFISITDNRAQRSITENFGDGFRHAVLTHDCWRSHFNTPAVSHQLCTSHLLRELNYFTERYANQWSLDCKELFKSALALKKRMTSEDYRRGLAERDTVEKDMDKLLERDIPPGEKELAAFQKRLAKYRGFLFTFLYHQAVPPDNNASERGIRNIKVKQKISGQFKSGHGGIAFAVLRSITDTIIKNNQNVFNSLKVIANLQTD